MSYSAQFKIIDNITTNVGEGFIPSRKRIEEPLNNFSAIETVLREGINPSPTSLNGPGFHVVSYKVLGFRSYVPLS
jgi:hypothetical protein